MKNITRIAILVLGTLTILVSITGINANAEYSTVDGESSGHISVTGNLLPEETVTSETIETPKEEVIPEKIIKPQEPNQVSKESNLPKTGEVNQSFYFLGMLIIIGGLIMTLTKIKYKESKKR